MTATTVPPPGLPPIGASELRANTRRFFTRALAISGVGHLAVLALVLWVQARSVELRPTWYEEAIDVIPVTPTPYRLKPPAAPTAAGVDPKSRSGGEIEPGMDPPILVEPGRGVKPVVPGSEKGEDQPTPPSANGITLEQEPGEGFVAHDRPPVPYHRPAPAYPSWARDQGIEGRVVLHVLVGRDGRVTRVRVIRHIQGLTDAAREAVAGWLFHPALSGKNPVAVWVEIPIEFKL